MLEWDEMTRKRLLQIMRVGGVLVLHVARVECFGHAAAAIVPTAAAPTSAFMRAARQRQACDSSGQSGTKHIQLLLGH